MKKVIKKELKFIGRRAFGALIFVAVAGTSLWALAAFSEPTTGPAASIQDFATNVLGANNTDNSFDSSSVTANADGSVLERLEALEKNNIGATAISSEHGGDNWNNAFEYCAELSATAQYALDGSDTATTYTDWRLPTVDELHSFSSFYSNYYYYWTTDARATNLNAYNTTYKQQFFTVRRYINNNYIEYSDFDASTYFRCVR